MRYLLLITALSLFACTDTKEKSDTTSKEEITYPSHTSQNSLDWAGTYSGIMPCASCEGIEASISLDYDHNYQLILIYLGEDEAAKVQRTGTFSWNEAGNTITLGDEDEPNQYFVGENYLAKLDVDGNRVKGDLAQHYILSKE